ncbi:hypothetical protein O9992_17220 [Vibrio lentus]|nr:hypothetical protein [Vibrio lentus]
MFVKDSLPKDVTRFTSLGNARHGPSTSGYRDKPVPPLSRSIRQAKHTACMRT